MTHRTVQPPAVAHCFSVQHSLVTSATMLILCYVFSFLFYSNPTIFPVIRKFLRSYSPFRSLHEIRLRLGFAKNSLFFHPVLFFLRVSSSVTRAKFVQREGRCQWQLSWLIRRQSARLSSRDNNNPLLLSISAASFAFANEAPDSLQTNVWLWGLSTHSHPFLSHPQPQVLTFALLNACSLLFYCRCATMTIIESPCNIIGPHRIGDIKHHKHCRTSIQFPNSPQFSQL